MNLFKSRSNWGTQVVLNYSVSEGSFILEKKHWFIEDHKEIQRMIPPWVVSSCCFSSSCCYARASVFLVKCKLPKDYAYFPNHLLWSRSPGLILPGTELFRKLTSAFLFVKWLQWFQMRSWIFKYCINATFYKNTWVQISGYHGLAARPWAY